MTNVIVVGTDPTAPFCAYGDESQYGDVLTYALAIFRREQVPKAEQVLEFLRERYVFPPQVPIHCKILFSGDQRRKHGLDHLDPGQVNDLVSKLVYHLNKLPALCRFGRTLLPDREILVPPDDDFPALPSEPKGVMGLLANSCFAVPRDGSHGPTPDQIEIFVSEDKTMIRFMRERRHQAHRGYSGFSDIGSPDGRVFRVEPRIVPGDQWQKHPLLQVADVFGYICSHADPPMERNDFFTKLLRSMPWSRGHLAFAGEEAVGAK
jgi:hypothetical protein